MVWDEVAGILQREKCTMVYFDMQDANDNRCDGADSCDALMATVLVVWVVSPAGQVR
jgi:hypothetical protein